MSQFWCPFLGSSVALICMNIEYVCYTYSVIIDLKFKFFIIVVVENSILTPEIGPDLNLIVVIQ